MTDPEKYDVFVSQILRPTNINSFRSETHNIQVLFHENSSDPDAVTDELVFDDIYPFYTIADLMVRIYSEKGNDLIFHPQNQALLLANDEEDLSKGYTHFQFSFFTGDGSPVILSNPFTQITSPPNPQFVFPSGNSTNIEIVNRENYMLETSLFHKSKENYILHCFTYMDLYNKYTGVKPISRLDWEGKFRPYFPGFSKQFEATGGLTPELVKFTEQKVRRFGEMDDLVKKIDSLLQDKTLTNVGNANFRNLRFGWKAPVYNPNEYEQFDMESIFYDTPVSEFIPYIRFFSSKGSPLSKVYVVGPANIPGMQDPEVLLQWAKDTSITPGEDLLMIKFLVRAPQGNFPPLYGTFFIFASGFAKMILQPNEDEKILSIQIDLINLAQVLEELTGLIPKLQPKSNVALPPFSLYTPKNIYLDETYTIFSLLLKRDDSAITQRSINEVLPFFRPFFQVTTSPLVEQNPLAFLRFKCVDNFRTPSRDFQFLRRIMPMQKLKGVQLVPTLVQLYAEEFNVPEQIAKERVGQFIQQETAMQKVNPDAMVLDYIQAKNPGLDIAIFGKHPAYTFHVYRIDSLDALLRIKTLLSLLVSIDPSEFGKSQKKSAEVLEEEDEEEQGEADTDAFIKMAKTPTTFNAAVDKVVSAQPSFGDDFDDLLAFGDEEPAKGIIVNNKGKSGKASVSRADLLDEEEDIDEEVLKPIKKDDEDIPLVRNISEFKKMAAKGYFLNRLYYHDKRLFYWRDTHPTFDQYPRRCSSTAMKQPAVMTEQAYMTMRELYTEDEAKGYVQFIDFPLKAGENIPKVPNDKTEIINTLRYGTNLTPGQANIYLCAEFWCRNDDIVILKRDFIGTKDRSTPPRYKDPNTCPFCGGKLIVNTKVYSREESIIQRSVKTGTSIKSHAFVGFLGGKDQGKAKGMHPNQLGLPCCFTKIDYKQPIRESDWQYTSFLQPKKAPLADKVTQLQIEEEKEDNLEVQRILQNTMPEEEEKEFVCGLKIRDMRKPYIVGAEKFPLEIKNQEPQVGILPAPVENYFSQSAIPNIVRLDHTVWKIITDNKTLKPNVSGFFRIAVDNTKSSHNDSFFSALAPYYQRNSANQMKEMFRDKLVPKRFLALNYGNFLFDFYNPSIAEPKEALLRKFVKDHFQIQVTYAHQKEAMIRLYKSYEFFLYSLTSKTTRKEYRQYAHVLSQNNIFSRDNRTNGLLFIVLEVDGKSVNVRCPPYGVSQHMMDTCDIAFITYYPKYHIWEPVFYTLNIPQENIHEFLFYFTRESKASWPVIVQQRVTEFFDMCKSSGLGVHTEVDGIKSETLLPLTDAMNIPGVKMYGVMRDVNNHVSNVLYYSEENTVIAVPVVDNGQLVDDVHPVFDWNDIYEHAANAKDVKEFYETKLAPITNMNPLWKQTYTLAMVIRLENKEIFSGSGTYMAYQLGNGLLIPIEEEDSSFTQEYTKTSVPLLPWMIDREIVYAERDPFIQENLALKDFEEVYQHLRLTFSNWIAVTGATVVDQINKIIFAKYIPVMEKRYALRNRFEKEIRSWLEPTSEYNQRKPSIKRVDCRVIRSAEDCTNRCAWRADGQCALHVPEKILLGNESVNAINLMISRLVEELIRFPQKRNEIILQKVSKYQKLFDGYRSGNEYIVPENLPAWTELLRMEWRKQESEQPKHLEEFTSLTSSEATKPRAKKPVIEPTAMPSKKPVIEPTAMPSKKPVIEPTAMPSKKPVIEPSKKPILQPVPVTKPIIVKAPPTDIPESLQAFFASTGAPFFFHQKEKSVLEVLCEFGLNLFNFVDTFNVREDISVLESQEQVDYVAKQLKRSIYQVMFEDDSPVLPEVMIARGLVKGSVEPYAPCIILLKTDKGKVGALSPERLSITDVPFSKIPSALRARMKKAKNIPLT
jgi:hypothetical protein